GFLGSFLLDGEWGGMVRWACKNPSLLGSFSASAPFPANGGPAAAQQGGSLYEKADVDSGPGCPAAGRLRRPGGGICLHRAAAGRSAGPPGLNPVFFDTLKGRSPAGERPFLCGDSVGLHGGFAVLFGGEVGPQ